MNEFEEIPLSEVEKCLLRIRNLSLEQLAVVLGPPLHVGGQSQYEKRYPDGKVEKVFYKQTHVFAGFGQYISEIRVNIRSDGALEYELRGNSKRSGTVKAPASSPRNQLLK